MDSINKDFVQQYIHPLSPNPTSEIPAGELTPGLRCLLFDIYGTLFISGSGDINLANQNSPHLEDIRTLLAKYKIRKNTRNLLDDFYRAIKAQHTTLRSSGIDFPEVIIDRIWQKVLPEFDRTRARQFAVEFELISNPVYPMPNLRELLYACRQKDLLMGIISNAQFYTPYLFKWFLDADITTLGFNPELIFYSYQFEIAKPSAALFDMAAKKLKEKKIQPQNVVYLGNDMLNDIYPAQMAGFQTALFAGDQRSLRLRNDHHCCKALKPDLIVTDLSQLVAQVQTGS